MKFSQDWRAAFFVAVLSALNVALSVVRYVHHGRHDRFALAQAIMWLCMFLGWASRASIRWNFTDTALLQHQIGFRKRVVPYEAVTSVAPLPRYTWRPMAVIRYGDSGPITHTQRITAEPADFAGFMEELERHIPAAAMHV